MQACLEHDEVLAYHDRSDGGLFVTLAEMAFAGHCGLDIRVDDLGDDPLAALISEEPGAVLKVAREHAETVQGRFSAVGLEVQIISLLNEADWLRIYRSVDVMFHHSLVFRPRFYSET